MNMKARRVDTTQRTIVFRLCIWKLAVSYKATIRCCVRPAVGTHPCARRILCRSPKSRPKSEGHHTSSFFPLTSYFPLLTSSFFPCRPSPGSQPGGMSKSRFRSFPQNCRVLYHNSARLCAARHGCRDFAHLPIARNQARRSLRRRDRSRLSPRAHTSSPRLLPRRRHGQEQVRPPARRRANSRFRASKPDSPPTEG